MSFERDPYKWFPHDYLLRYTLLPLIPSWISPNMITVFRMILTPFVLWVLLKENYSVGIPFFLFTAGTDALDGSLARVRKQITPWGTFYDPVADKLLIGSVVFLIVARHINPIIAILIIFFELAIIFVGYLRKAKGAVISANIFGKTKMFLQVLGVTFLLLAVYSGHDMFIQVSYGTLALAIVFAVVSLFTYGF